MQNSKYKNPRFLTGILPFLFLVLSFIGCASVPTTVVPPKPPAGVPGFYHRVEHGETLWRICRIHNADLEEITGLNHISDAARIETGQLIFIPKKEKAPKVNYVGRYGEEDFIWPIRGRVISTFGQTTNNMVNKGLNIQPYDNTNVFASRSGRVVFRNASLHGFGSMVIIDHGDGFSTVYARNRKVLVALGDSVNQGMIIAQAGSAGRDRDVYLHFEIRKAHIAQNPYFYLP